MITLAFYWWMLPVAIAVIGCIWGFYVANVPECGVFPMNPLAGALIITASIVVALAICIGHWVR